MSNSQTIKYKCPYCQKEFDIEIYNTVNVRQDPDLKDRCKSGDIFQHSCPHCHSDFMIQNPLLYEDQDHQFVILVSSEDTGSQLKTFAEPLVKKGYTLRRCSTVKEFVEKIQIFEDGANDIAVELAKYDSFIDFLDSRKGDPKKVTSIDYVYTKDDVMKIDIRIEDRGMSFLIPVSGLNEELEADKELFEVDELTFPCINSEWMISLFTKQEDESHNFTN